MKDKQNARELFKQAIQKDPFLVGLIWNINLDGIHILTDFGTLIIKMYNPKTGITIILDPAKPYLFINDNGTSFNIPIKEAIQITATTFGIPQVEEIPKFGTNIPLKWDIHDLKNTP